MTKKASVRDVANEAGVSIGSVSRVLNGGTYVSPALEAKVRAAAEKLGYRPNANARNLRTGSSKTVGCLIPDIANPLYASYVAAIEARLQESGYMLLLGNTKGSPEREQELMRIFFSRGMDGIIATPINDAEPKAAAIFEQCQLPLVILDRDLHIECDMIGVDHRPGMRKAIEYLFSLGHERIALFTPGEHIRPGRERIAGYYEAYAAAGRTVDSSLVKQINPRLLSSYDDMKAMLASPAPPTAVIGLGTRILSAALRAVHEAGLAVPGDMSVIAIGTPDTLEFAYPAMSMLRFDLDDHGRVAAELLLDRIKNGDTTPYRRITKPMELVIAGSCAGPKVLKR